MFKRLLCFTCLMSAVYLMIISSSITEQICASTIPGMHYLIEIVWTWDNILRYISLCQSLNLNMASVSSCCRSLLPIVYDLVLLKAFAVCPFKAICVVLVVSCLISGTNMWYSGVSCYMLIVHVTGSNCRLICQVLCVFIQVWRVLSVFLWKRLQLQDADCAQIPVHSQAVALLAQHHQMGVTSTARIAQKKTRRSFPKSV